ncbi:MAG: hypothetical protein AAGC46_08200 [Solirubrobacteraceae bacterium]|nr:hypothetical protein [Patulibacter sp.]
MFDDSRLTDWLEAERRVAREPTPRRVLLDDLVDTLLAELRRKLGRPFMLDELIAFYEGGTAWAVDLLTTSAPKDPWAWAPNLAVDAAFSRYARFARDVGGGRRIGQKRFSENDMGRIIN